MHSSLWEANAAWSRKRVALSPRPWESCSQSVVPFAETALMRLVGLGIVITLCSLTGCAQFAACRSDVTHRYQASRAWHYHAHDCDRGDYPRQFTAGWKEGYLAITSGSSGEIPPVPPEEFWKDRFRTPEGRGRVDAWYSGYQCGVMAAEKDGVGILAHIPVGPGMYQRMPTMWEPGEWKRPTTVPTPEQLPDGSAEDGMVRRPVEPRLAVATPPAGPVAAPAPVAEVHPQPVAPVAPRVAIQPIPAKEVAVDKQLSEQYDAAKLPSLKEKPQQQVAPVAPRVAAGPVPAKARVGQPEAQDQHNRTKEATANEQTQKPTAGVTPRVADWPVPADEAKVQKQAPEQRDRTKEVTAKEESPKQAARNSSRNSSAEAVQRRGCRARRPRQGWPHKRSVHERGVAKADFARARSRCDPARSHRGGNRGREVGGRAARHETIAHGRAEGRDGFAGEFSRCSSVCPRRRSTRERVEGGHSRPRENLEGE